MSIAQACFFPDGSASLRDSPCHAPFTEDGASACCAHNDVCLDNKLCLSQSGSALITRGSCTDQTWQSPECSQYCADVRTSGGIEIDVIDYPSGVLSCCGRVESNDTCKHATQGRTAPFHIEAGRVIFNRTSGSTSPNNTNDVPSTVTFTSTASVSASVLPSASNSPYNHIAPSSSAGKDAAIGAGVSGLLALAFLVTLGLLWRQTRQKQSLRKDFETLEGRYARSMEITAVEIGGAEQKPPYLLGCSNSDGAHDQQHLTYHLQAWNPDEADGSPVCEMANRKGGA